MILGVFTELLNMGGVQRLGRHQALILREIAKEKGVDFRVITLNEDVGEHELNVGDITLEIEGFGRSKKALSKAILNDAAKLDLIYFGHPHLAPPGVLARLKNRRLRYLVHAHGIEVWKRMPFYKQLGLRFAHTVTLSSAFTGERLLQEQWLKPKRLEVLHPTLDPDFPAIEPVDDDSDDLPPLLTSGGNEIPEGPIVLSVARLASYEKEKGFDSVIESLPGVLDVVPTLQYLLVGQGDDIPRLMAVANAAGVGDHVHFLGSVDDARLSRLYRKADVFIMPSAKEGFGIVFLEAMSYGIPVIGGDTGGTPEIIAEGETGFLVGSLDVEKIAMRLRAILTDDEVRQGMGEKGKQRLEEMFTFDHFRKRFREIIENALT